VNRWDDLAHVKDRYERMRILDQLPARRYGAELVLQMWPVRNQFSVTVAIQTMQDNIDNRMATWKPQPMGSPQFVLDALTVVAEAIQDLKAWQQRWP